SPSGRRCARSGPSMPPGLSCSGSSPTSRRSRSGCPRSFTEGLAMHYVRTFPAVDAGHGVTRQVVADSPELMLVAVTFASGGEGPPHSHPHVQSTFVRSGRFAFTIGGESFEVGPGDAFVIPANTEHSCRALEPGTLLDSFTPRRADFL